MILLLLLSFKLLGDPLWHLRCPNLDCSSARPSVLYTVSQKSSTLHLAP